MRYLWNDGWKFMITPVGTSYEEAWEKREEAGAVDLPHDWLIYDAEKLYEDGTGWYFKQFSYEKQEAQRAFLTFDGIYMDSTIYVNGKKAGEWKYGYSAFTLEITGLLLDGRNEVAVSACFQSPNSRWYSGAGIYRNVWLSITGKSYLVQDGVYLSTRQQGEDYLLRIETEVAGLPEEQMQTEHVLYAYDPEKKEMQPASMELLKEEDGAKIYLVKKPMCWDVESPNLYKLFTYLLKQKEGAENSFADGEKRLNKEAETSFADGGKQLKEGDCREVLDMAEDTVGFRSVSFDPAKGFFLNGRKLKLNGVCEHHDLGALGAAFNKAAMRRKFCMLKKMGVNAIRGSHNMMAKEALELADEMGLLLISEAFDMWERSKTPYDYARFFKEWSQKDVASWIRRDRNHPSVILWSIGNEIYDTHADAHGLEITRYLTEEVKKHDPYQNARVTIGSNYMPWENAQKCADVYKIAGYNYSEKYYKEHHEKHPDWVIYGSETSSLVQSRGVYHFPLAAGILAEDDEQCSALGNSATSWGAKSMEDCITMDRDMDFSMGQFLWTGFDYIGEPTPYHTKNSYFGQIDTAGFPKDSYYVWQSVWTDVKKNPMVHIFPYWDFNPGQKIDLRVCSNAPVVELFLNGRSLGRQRLTHEPGSGRRVIADYQALYEEGTIMAVGYDEEGREIARESRESFTDSKALVLTPENTQLTADGRDLWFVQISAVDEKKRTVENACDRVLVEVSGAGRLVGLDNGDSTDLDSYKGKSRRLFNGKLLAMIQTNAEPGKITIKVSGKGLKGTELTCSSSAAEESGRGISCLEENTDLPVVMGETGEIPVRKILLTADGERIFTPERRTIMVNAHILPENAKDKELIFKEVNDMGVESNLVTVEPKENGVLLCALGDGEFRLRCMSKSGTDKIRLISQLEFKITGLGEAYLNPYGFISGSQYTGVKGEAGNGNEKGVATARDTKTVVTYTGIDFGSQGSDEITVPIFALTDEEYPIQIWEGVPEEEGSSLLADVVYQKPSIWNVYQSETWKLNKLLKGVTSISFLTCQKIHIKGFSFTESIKAWKKLFACEADAVYGDSFVRMKESVEQIGNNVSLVFREMDFAGEGAAKLKICGRAPENDNTIHVRFFNGEEEIKQIVEFKRCSEWEEQEFLLRPLGGKWEITFVFLPGSCFDFRWFCFEKENRPSDGITAV